MNFKLSKSQIKNNINKVKNLLNEDNIDAIYISSFDEFFNEYVELNECIRYYVTGFTGSSSECLITKNEVVIFLDGRYFEQGDIECLPLGIKIVKVGTDKKVMDVFDDFLKEQKIIKLAIIDERTPFSMYKKYLVEKSVKTYSIELIKDLIDYKELSKESSLYPVDIKDCGESSDSKIRRILNDNECMFLSNLDSIAWLTNFRSFEMNFQATFKSKILFTKEKIFIFTHQLNFLKSKEYKSNTLIWIRYSEMEKTVKELAISYKNCFLDKKSVSLKDYLMLNKYFAESILIDKENGVYDYQCIKNATEIKAFKEAFENSDRAIFNGFKKAKTLSHNITELELFNLFNDEYKKVGSLMQSFNTICGVGKNSSIIHYNDPKDNLKYEEGELLLIDSGAFYKAGLATDCTRTACLNGSANEQTRLIYTTVMKSLLLLMAYEFDESTSGIELNNICSKYIEDAGFKLVHGTGHGVGVNVHEKGYRISAKAEDGLKEGTVGSIEPGIYIEGLGGVRLENCVIVKKNTKNKLYFESLVYIGFEPDLIDFSLLNKEDLKRFNDYEKLCAKKGRSLVF